MAAVPWDQHSNTHFASQCPYFILCFSVSPHAASHLFYPEVYDVVYPFQITIFQLDLPGERAQCCKFFGFFPRISGFLLEI